MLAATPRGHALKRVHPSKGRLCSKPADIRARLTLPTERSSEGAVADGSGSALSPPRWVRQPRGSAVLTEYEYTPRETLRSAAPHPRGGARAVGLTACGPIPRCTRVLTTQAPRPIKVTTLSRERVRSSKDPSIHRSEASTIELGEREFSRASPPRPTWICSGRLSKDAGARGEASG